MANPYELRLELLNSAENRLIQRFEADRSRYDAAILRYETLKEHGEEVPYPDIDYPKFPSDDEITELAYEMKKFVSEKGDES
tara:strand:- start:118 stop:363 length:246 start_codon:yes stop_codon:yes gene_type:complete